LGRNCFFPNLILLKNSVNQPNMTIVNVNSLLDEELFQHIWQFRLFTQSGLTTQEGESLQIDHPGQLNRNAGPDFNNARIRIGTTLWIGNVELHLKTSEWFRHGHHHNLQYRNVILHVVFEHDMKDVRTNGIPILELQYGIPKLLLQRYEGLRHSAAFVPCAGSVAEAPPLIWTSWKDRLQVERMEQKADVLKNWLMQTRNDWEEVFYQAIARGLGGPVNGENFLRLARSLPFKLLRRHQHNLLQLEALLFGQAGMLEEEEEIPKQGKNLPVPDPGRYDAGTYQTGGGDVAGGFPGDYLSGAESSRSVNDCASQDGSQASGYTGKVQAALKHRTRGGLDQVLPAESEAGRASDEYFQLLKQEYNYLRHKYQLQPMNKQSWKWLRMRPASFPGVKIAYLAALLYKGERLFSRILEATDISSLMAILKVKPSAYWKEHYAFGKKMLRNPKPGKSAAHSILINTVFPLLYQYGREKGNGEYQERALNCQSQLPPEDNHIISRWKMLGISALNASDTQALLQLKQAYCDGKHCLRCAVGAKLLRKSIL